MKLQRSRPRNGLDQLALARMTSAFAAASLGALAVGAVAVGRLVVRRLIVGDARVLRVRVHQNIRRTRIREFVRDDVPPPPIR